MADSADPRGLSLVADLRGVFSDRLRAVVAYGQPQDGKAALTCLALVASLTVDDLEACAAHASKWRRAEIATPLIVPEREFRRSLDAFPLEYAEIIGTHQRLHGGDPFDGVTIHRDDLRRACETQVKSHLLHLREGFIESGGQPGAVGSLVTASAPAFATLMRNVARLYGVHTSAHMDATLAGAKAAGLPEGVVAEVLNLERPSGVSAGDPARLFRDYIAAVEQLARTVDQWQ